MRYFVTSIDSGIGKTVVSSILVQALSANYWKPIQCGNLDQTDSMIISELTSKRINIYPESYLFTSALPVQLAAKEDGKKISLKDIVSPSSTQLIIEDTGNLLNPINEKENYLLDLLPFWDAEIILVIKNTKEISEAALATINHLQTNNYPIKGIIVNGNDKNKEIIASQTEVPILFHIPYIEEVSPKFIKEQASQVRSLFSV